MINLYFWHRSHFRNYITKYFNSTQKNIFVQKFVMIMQQNRRVRHRRKPIRWNPNITQVRAIRRSRKNPCNNVQILLLCTIHHCLKPWIFGINRSQNCFRIDIILLFNPTCIIMSNIMLISKLPLQKWILQPTFLKAMQTCLIFKIKSVVPFLTTIIPHNHAITQHVVEQKTSYRCQTKKAACLW